LFALRGCVPFTYRGAGPPHIWYMFGLRANPLSRLALFSGRHYKRSAAFPQGQAAFSVLGMVGVPGSKCVRGVLSERRAGAFELPRIRFTRNTNAALCRGLRLAVAYSETLLLVGGIKRGCERVPSAGLVEAEPPTPPRPPQAPCVRLRARARAGVLCPPRLLAACLR